MKIEQKVVKIARTSDREDSWLKLTVIDEKGKERQVLIKDQSVIPNVNKEGFYEFTKEKDGQYWEVTGAKFLRPLSGGSSGGSSAGGAAKASTVSGVADVNVIIREKAITSQVCIKAAAEIVCKGLEVGAFKDNDGHQDFMAAQDAAMILSTGLMKGAGDFIRGCEAKKGAYKDEAGRTHEPVDQGGHAEGA